jgi:hypothetical protein
MQPIFTQIKKYRIKFSPVFLHFYVKQMLASYLIYEQSEKLTKTLICKVFSFIVNFAFY